MQAKGNYNVASLFGVTIVLINFQVPTNAFYIAISWKFLRTIPVIAVKHFTLLSQSFPVKTIKNFSIYGHCILVIFLWWRTYLFTWSQLESVYIGNFLWWKTTFSHGSFRETLACFKNMHPPPHKGESSACFRWTPHVWGPSPREGRMYVSETCNYLNFSVNDMQKGNNLLRTTRLFLYKGPITGEIIKFTW